MVLSSQKMVLSLMNLLILKKKLLRSFRFVALSCGGGGCGFEDLSGAKSGGGGRHQLAKELSVLHLIAIGVGSTIEARVYILVGTVAREHSGPALTFSFLIAGIAAALSAFCYAELASGCPSAGSAYHYSYICVGEGYIITAGAITALWSTLMCFRGRFAKDGLIQYCIVCQQVNVTSLEEVMKHFMQTL
ncbi:hypothetical protein NL676_012050 [Syzygium grande]|nr:hypothetical protein NL676_012050 [Syzygium grande]